MPRLSIIIVTFNSRAEIDACLRSLTDGIHVDREIVIVDNASTDDTAQHIRERWPGVRLVSLGANLGFARATNIGIQQTFGELTLSFDLEASALLNLKMAADSYRAARPEAE